MRTRHLAATAAVAIALGIYGCNGGSFTPLNPGAEDAGFHTGPAPFGHYTLAIDGLDAALIPDTRAQAFADSANYDATQYFTAAPCSDCAKIVGVALTADRKIAIDVAIQHPWRDTTERLDLDAFDVRGILGVDPAVTFPSTPGIGEAPLTTNPGILANADGYTTHFHEALTHTDATLNPFRRFFTEDDPDPAVTGAWIPNHKMPMASEWDVQRYLLDAPVGPVSYDFLIEVAYGVAAKSPENAAPEEPAGRLNPQYYLPEYNQKEAWRLALDLVTAPAADTEGALELHAGAVDWQTGFAVDETYPNPEHLDRLKAVSNISGLSLEIPGLGIYSTDPTWGTGTGSLADPMDWTFEFNLPPTAESTNPALLTVIDDLYDPETITSSGQDYRAFQVLVVDIREGGQQGELPVAVLESQPAPATAILREATFRFLGSNSYDPDSSPLTAFEFDLDYDGATFDIDYSGAIPEEATVDHTYLAVGTYTVALRVRNDQGEVSDIATLPVIVDPDPIVVSPMVQWDEGIDLLLLGEIGVINNPTDSAITIGSDGKAHLVYYTESEGIFLGTELNMFYQGIRADGTLQAAENLLSELYMDPVTPKMAVAVSPSNTVGVVYATQNEITYTAKGGTTWSAPTVIGSADTFVGERLGELDLAINEDNDKAVGFEIYFEGAPNLPVQYRVSINQSGAWVIDANVGSTYGPTLWPQINAIGEGFIASWHGWPTEDAAQEDIFVRRHNGTMWTPKETVTGDEGLGESSPALAVSQEGSVTVAYRKLLGLYSRSSLNGGPWSAERALYVADATHFYEPPALIGGAGHAVVLVARELAEEGDRGHLVTLAFSAEHLEPGLDGEPAEIDPHNQIFINPDLGSNGLLSLGLFLESPQEGGMQLRYIPGVLSFPQ